MKDAEIIELYVQRKEAAIAQTARKYGAYLNQVAYNILRSREDTEEIVSDTYLAAWNAIPPQHPRVFRHFLSRITRNLSFDRLDYRMAGKRSGHMDTLLSELEDCIPDRSASLESRMETKAIGTAINGFLSQQSKNDCALFVCRYFYGMTVMEIGKRQGMSEGTVKYRLGLLRRKLRKHLEREGITV